ncbi:MAG: beta-ketoacyl-[acyl-carrier-protein] synthase family protein [Thermoguttaceae bacterium]
MAVLSPKDSSNEVVLTGMGVLTPIGIDLATYWDALCQRTSGIGRVRSFVTDESRQQLGGEVPDFPAKDYIKPRKNIKVMSRDIQLGFVAAMLAATQARLVYEGDTRSVDHDRIGVVFGSDLIGAEIDALLDAYKAGIENGKHNFNTWGEAAMREVFPLWMLKHLPNMPACHIAIAMDARGPSNTVTVCRGSALASIFEGIRAIERGISDVMVCGSVGNRVNPDFLARGRSYELAAASCDPASVPRPFDADRCGCVLAEGAGAYVLERRAFAEARGATILATVRGFAATTEAILHGQKSTGEAIRRAIRIALETSNISPQQLAHVNADGMGTPHDDAIEAAAIHAELGDVPVFAPKGNFGDAGAGAGAIELAASVLALQHKQVPPICHCDNVAADCPINAVRETPLARPQRFALKLNQTRMGRSFAIVLEAEGERRQ